MPMEARSKRRVSSGRKRSRIPLSSLRTAEALRTIVACPRRLDELVSIMEDSDRVVRDRAAATLARLAETHPERLLRILERLKEALADDSAYVRWNLVFSLGTVGARFPRCALELLPELTDRLDDNNRVVRDMACRALLRFAEHDPHRVAEHFEVCRRPLPRALKLLLDTHAPGRGRRK